MRYPRSLLLLATGLAGFAASPAWALPAATTLAHCAVGGSFLDDPTSCTLGAADNTSVSLTTSPFVGLTAEASSPIAPGLHGASGTAIVHYSFSVTGGVPGDVVPILIAASLEANGSDSTNSYAFGSLTVNTGAAGLATLVAVCNNGTCAADSFSGTLSTRARSGDLGDFIELQIQASVTGNALSAESARASADPFLFVDPSFPGASLYAIEVSPGVANTPAAEPSSASLIGLGALLWAASSRGARRRR